MGDISIIDTDLEKAAAFGLCGYKNLKKEGLPEKIEWLEKRLPEGLKIKTLLSETDGAQGMIEYIPGEYCWRPVNAGGYMFIHCIFVGFKKKYKNNGYASRLLEQCEHEAKALKKNGVAVVTRKGSFMAGKDLFIKHGYEVVDFAKPDFELLVKKTTRIRSNPTFNIPAAEVLDRYGDGLTIIRAGQCPYTVKNVREICEAAQKDYGLAPQIINLEDYRDAQNCPSPFGTFCVLYQGRVVADNPISKGRFVNIMNKLNA